MYRYVCIISIMYVIVIMQVVIMILYIYLQLIIIILILKGSVHMGAYGCKNIWVFRKEFQLQ